jgi:hypothetical protein
MRLPLPTRPAVQTRSVIVSAAAAQAPIDDSALRELKYPQWTWRPIAFATCEVGDWSS